MANFNVGVNDLTLACVDNVTVKGQLTMKTRSPVFFAFHLRM